jgi:hypothetical protein
VAHAFRGLRSQKQTQSSHATKEKQDSIVSQGHPDQFMPGRDDIAVAADTLVDTKPPPVHSQNKGRRLNIAQACRYSNFFRKT